MSYNERTRVLEAIKVERKQQDAKWGQQDHDNFTWLAILSEEIGEVAQAALHDVFGGRAAGTIYRELIQVAAVAVAWLECLERRDLQRILGTDKDDQSETR